MDIISFNEAATANGRIEKFIENPDSTSGIVTVPKVIASGETITIPAGRVAILPNVQIDGVLNVEGEVFIPSGATFDGVVEKVTSTDNAIVRFNGTTGEVQDSSILIDDNGNLNINGTGKRITGDFSNATRSQMVAFKSSTTDGNTFLSAIPNGTGIASGYLSYAYTDADNSPLLATYCANNESVITSAKSGTGSYLPINIYTTGSKKVTIDTSGNLLLTSGTGGIGYGAGSGGTVTQLTNKGTAVTLNKPTGQIIMNNAALAAGVLVYFRVSNSLFSADDTVIANFKGGGIEYASYRLGVTSDGASGYFYIHIENRTGTSKSEAVQIKYEIIKGANS